MKQGLEYAILTNELTKAWAGKNVKEYKKHKGEIKVEIEIGKGSAFTIILPGDLQQTHEPA